jgi:hypothetical protein
MPRAPEALSQIDAWFVDRADATFVVTHKKKDLKRILKVRRRIVS